MAPTAQGREAPVAGQGRWRLGEEKQFFLALYHIGNPNPNMCWVIY
jgi:hypothetical protein